jgi:hypothetical protein
MEQSSAQEDQLGVAPSGFDAEPPEAQTQSVAGRIQESRAPTGTTRSGAVANKVQPMRALARW